ncbi:LOG family protein [Weissella fangxianensis]|uniref:LOG family protein n=1 Tax=Weissella fangxianensis TaxID=2953879 RepID=UPI00215727E1|nr:LOG family protein [Weissella fangxianensis]
MPKQLVDRSASFTRLTDLKIVDDMATRKATMLSLADACIALPGGPGTLDEIFEFIATYQPPKIRTYVQ